VNVFIVTPANAVRLLVCFVTLMNCCHSASGQDTISDIQGTHSKPRLKTTHRVRPASHPAKPHKTVALRHSLLPLKHRIASHNTQKAGLRPTQNEIADVSIFSSQPHLIGWWRADNNVLKSLDNSGSVHGKVSYVSGVFGQAFQFDGTGGINLGDPDILKLTKSFSISAWVNVTSLPTPSQNWGQILFRGDRRPGLDPYQLAVSPYGDYNFQVTNASNNYSAVQAPVRLNQWTFLTATLDDKRSLMTLYVNGKVASRGSTTIRPLRDLDLNFNPGVSIGDDGEYLNSPSHECFSGAIADVRMYTGVLGERQIASDYEQGRSSLTAANGGKVNASSSLPNPVFFADNFSDPAKSAQNWDQTTNGGTLLFSKGSVVLKGVGGGYPVIKTKRNPFPLTGDWIATFTYRYTSIGNYGTELTCGRDRGNFLVRVHQDVNGQLVQLDGKDLPTTAPNTNQHIVTFVKIGVTLTVYLDGLKIGSDQAGTNPSFISIGGGSEKNPWDWNDVEVSFVGVERRL